MVSWRGFQTGKMFQCTRGRGLEFTHSAIQLQCISISEHSSQYFLQQPLSCVEQRAQWDEYVVIYELLSESNSVNINVSV